MWRRGAGNLDTIAIECIGNRKLSEDTTAKLVAWLCKKHGLNPKTDIYTHKYFYPKKNCPAYILPHWNTFLATVQKHYNALTCKPAAPKAETSGRTHTVKHGDTLWKIAEQYLGKGSRYTEIVKLNGLKSNVLYTGQVLKIPENSYQLCPSSHQSFAKGPPRTIQRMNLKNKAINFKRSCQHLRAAFAA